MQTTKILLTLLIASYIFSQCATKIDPIIDTPKLLARAWVTTGLKVKADSKIYELPKGLVKANAISFDGNGKVIGNNNTGIYNLSEGNTKLTFVSGGYADIFYITSISDKTLELTRQEIDASKDIDIIIATSPIDLVAFRLRDEIDYFFKLQNLDSKKITPTPKAFQLITTWTAQ